MPFQSHYKAGYSRLCPDDCVFFNSIHRIVAQQPGHSLSGSTRRAPPGVESLGMQKFTRWCMWVRQRKMKKSVSFIVSVVPR